MTTHEEWVIKCPNCHRAYDLFWISSSNNFGGEFWSDGCSASPCSYPLTGLYSCQICNWVFTFGECDRFDPSAPDTDKLFQTDRPWRAGRERATRPRRKRYLDPVRMEKCAFLVHANKWSPENDFEPILRLGWWWNDESTNRIQALQIAAALDAQHEDALQLSEPTVRNMSRLIGILPNEPRNAIIAGDLNRRLGMFADAVSFYGRMPAYQAELKDQLITLAERRYRSVVRLA